MHHGEAHMPQHSARALPLQLAAGGVGSPASGAVSSSRPTPPPREEPQQQQPDHASASWKTVQLDDTLVTIAVFSSSDMRWSVPPFHEKVRTTTLSRWLLKKHGQVVVQRTHQTVCPLLPRRWFPSGKMLQRKRKLDDSGDGCRFIMANCTWILMYLLAANHFKTQGQGSKAEATLSGKSFQLLQRLVHLGAKNCPETLRVFRTHYGPARLEHHGSITCDDET